MTEERLQRLQQVLQKRQGNLTVVMENVQDPHNISAVLRTCESVGIQDVYVLTTGIPRHKKFGTETGFRSSGGAAKWLTIHEFSILEDCVNALKEKEYKIYTTALSAQAKSLYEMDFTQRSALVFGNERFGVSREMLQKSDGNFIIPQMGVVRSLNISVACAVCLYEAFRQKMTAGHYGRSSLPEKQVLALEKEWQIAREMKF